MHGTGFDVKRIATGDPEKRKAPRMKRRNKFSAGSRRVPQSTHAPPTGAIAMQATAVRATVTARVRARAIVAQEAGAIVAEAGAIVAEAGAIVADRDRISKASLCKPDRCRTLGFKVLGQGLWFGI